MGIEKDKNQNRVTGPGQETVLITGSTGFIGSHIARKIIESRRSKVILLVRAEDDSAAMSRLKKEWWDWKELQKVVPGDRVDVVAGDICKPRFGMSPENYLYLTLNVTHIIHAAAETRIDAPLKELMRVNVEGIRNIIGLAEELYKNGKLSRLSHVSTAYVCGRQSGRISEELLSDTGGFISDYESSKYMGELLVREVMDKLPVTIFRPSMVVGDSRTGEIKTFNTIYYPLRLYLNMILRIFPVRPSRGLDLVPVDYVADSIVDLTFMKAAENLTFHLTCPPECQPTLKEISEFVSLWVKKTHMIKLPAPLFMPVKPALLKLWYRVSGRSSPGSVKSRTIKNMLALIDYLYIDREFSRKNTEQILGLYRFQWKSYFGKILEFAVYNGFLHRSGRTVHEQVLFRLGSRSRKINYYDVTGKNIKHRKPEDISHEILLAANSMIEYGVKPGDRIAVIGYNSTRYLSIDTATGLIGAISVPLYYTSTAAMINEVLKECRAKIIFIGKKSYIGELKDILRGLDDEKILVVTFFESNDTGNSSISWKDFLGRGKTKLDPVTDFQKFTLPGDTATIRYSSGTTGKPKGVVFDHYSLRWMAESLNSLFPWKERNSKVTYLSFLPLNHVVEGILTNYALYYIPASADIYFLRDFSDLGSVLPRIRPTAFFSVPRFYEKVHEGFNCSGTGMIYNRMPFFVKKLFKPVIKYIILKRSGLIRCIQPIVGSAPVSPELLLWFESIGIHIHNAYGLTEAPLVTLNRFGKNKIGTAGQLLPETEIKIRDDMEITVRGPQVTAGYYRKRKSEQPFILDKKSGDRYLLTGDIGDLDKDGYLIIKDRKKDIIITSYGKNIQPFHIESKLKNIQGIAEAMLVGDGKPYCMALAWLQKVGGSEFDRLDREIIQLNKELSSPERIKRWVFIKYDLNIEDGLLTPNLKLRRGNIVFQRRDLIQMIYSITDTGDFKKLNNVLSGDKQMDITDKRTTKMLDSANKGGALHFGCINVNGNQGGRY